MMQVVFAYDHGTWKEGRTSNWYKTDEEVQNFIDYIKSKESPATDIKVMELVNVTDRFRI